MLPGSRPRALLAAAAGLLLSVGIALPASAAPVALPGLELLQSVMAVLDSRSESVPDSVTGWYVDPATNSVVVRTTDVAAARTFAAGQRAVRIEQVNARPVPLADLQGGDMITSSTGGRCSVGFNAVSGQTRYIITAGHCAKLGGTWSGPNGRVIGSAVKFSFPGDDFGLVEVASEAWDQTHEVEADRGNINVAGIIPAEVGDRVCLSGSTSGYHCGRVEAVGETVNYGNGDVVRGLTRTSVCAEGGDSGGPFMSGDQAQGTLSGGTGGCLLGGQSYFQPIQEVLSTYGLTLLTGRASRDES
ncbi:MAG: S1 family peptidase [Pseudonocardiaceae bacterium]